MHVLSCSNQELEKPVPGDLNNNNSEYAGDVQPREAWQALKDAPSSVLIDVRTKAEWVFVGTPDLSGIEKETLLVEWQAFPSMQVNPSFAEEVAKGFSEREFDVNTPAFFLCRSGGRSKEAAIAMTAKGYKKCFNIVSGFEGDLNEDRHRGQGAGWKAEGLPWGQR